jgi:branched-chain amino acid transport system permease protein
VLRPLLGQPAFTVVMVTIGIGYLARGVVTMIPYWGTETHTLPVPWKDEVFWLGETGKGLVVSLEHMSPSSSPPWRWWYCCTCLLPLHQDRHRDAGHLAEPAGRLLHGHSGAAHQHADLGLSPPSAACAALLLAPITFVHANMGFVGLKAFPAAVVGGFGSIPGALVGGLIIGIVESLAGFYLPEGFKDIAAYVVVLVMLVVKPNGLFGENLTKKV